MGKMYVYKKLPIVAIQVEGYPERFSLSIP